MGFHELHLKDFRLFRELHLNLNPDAITIFLSANGTGKTSILEAIVALSTASSFRSTLAADLIKQGSNGAEVHGIAYQGERRVQIDLTLTRTPRNTIKQMLVNGQRPKSRADLGDVLPLTLFTPEGVDVVRGGPEHRRTFLNTLLTDLNHHAGEILERYAKTLSQRNALLRTFEGRPPHHSKRDDFELWTSELCVIADELVNIRLETLTSLAPLTQMSYHQLSNQDLSVSLDYLPSWGTSLKDAFRESLKDDLFRGYTTIGPHRDDFVISIDSRDSRRQASQGEQRSLALALRLAGHQLVELRRGVHPLILLDDVFSELDPMRSERLLKILPMGQTLVTTASPLPLPLAQEQIIDLSSYHAA